VAANRRKPVVNAPRNNSIIARAQCTCHQSVSFADWKQAGCEWVGVLEGACILHYCLLTLVCGVQPLISAWITFALLPARILHNVQLHAALRSKMERRRPPSLALARRQHVTFAPSAEFQYSTQYNAVRTPRALWICMRV
jgi:hypothetical protein